MTIRYQIQGLLGEGGMGRVFLAEDQAQNRLVALKFLQSSVAPHLAEEARLLARLSHPNLIQIYDFHHEAESLVSDASLAGPCYSMEYFSGENLDHFAKHSPISAEAWIAILDMLAAGLGYLHARRILHRDLKPANILVNAKLELKILDFGLSTLKDALKIQNNTLGTLAYLPPEAYSGDYEARSDLYALGLSLFESITGTLPPSGRNRQKVPLPDLKKTHPKLPTFFCNILNRLLEPHPSRRPSSAWVILQYLRQHRDTLPALPERDARETLLEKPPLVGREVELEQIQKFLTSPLSPALRCLQLLGPTGVGRSRLLEEAKWHFQLGGGTWLSVSPQESESWLQTAHKRFDSAGKTDQRDWLNLAETFLRQTASTACALVFHDLHLWPEKAIQELQIFLNMARRTSSQLRILFDINSDWEKNALKILLHSLQNSDAGTILKLCDLAPEACASMLQPLVAEGCLTEALSQEWIIASGGRPLLLLETVRQALRDRTINGRTTPLVPKNLQEVSRHKIQSLESQEKELLAMILVHPEASPSLDAIRGLLNESFPRWEEALLSLSCHGWLQERSPDGLIKLVQPSLKSSYIKALTAKLVHRCHRRWLDWYVQHYGDQPKVIPEAPIIAEYAFCAGETQIAKNWGFAAAAFFESQGRPEAAVECLHRLLPFAKTGEERYTLYGHLAPLYYRLSRLDEAIEAYDRWFQDRPDDDTLLQKAKHRFFTGLVHYAAKREATARELFEECLKIGPRGCHSSHHPYHARALSFLASLDEKNGDFNQARARLAQARELAHSDPILMGEIEQRSGELEEACLCFEKAFGHFQNCLELYRKSGRSQAEGVALQFLATLLNRYGRSQEALPFITQALEFTKQGGQIAEWARYQANQAVIQQALGDYGAARNSLEKAFEILEVLGTDEDRFILQINDANLSLYSGNLERASCIFRQLESKRPALDNQGLLSEFLRVQAEFAYVHGDPGAAEIFFSKAQESLAKKEKSHSRIMVGLGICRSLARQGRLQSSAPVYADLMRRLDSSEGPIIELWRTVLPFLIIGNKFDTDTESLAKLLSNISCISLPELRRDLWELLSISLQRQGMGGSAQACIEASRQDFHIILNSLPEDIQMDYEKNRGPISLDGEVTALVHKKSIRVAAKNSQATKASQTPAPLSSPALNEIPAGARKDGAQLSERRFQQFTLITRQITQKHDLKDILERLMDAAIELTGAERGFLLLKNENNKEGAFPGFEIRAARQFQQRELDKEEFQISMSAVRHAVEAGGLLLTENALLDPRLNQKNSVVHYQLKSILVVPIELDSNIIGVIYLDHRFHSDCFAGEDVVFLNAFVAQAALVIQNSQLLEELRSTKRKLEEKVDNQAEHIKTLADELAQVRDQLRYGYEEIIGQSPSMMRVFQSLDHVTETMIPVWIHGESGTGKELVARSLHFNSPRKTGPFVSENCSAIPEMLLESELFGHKKGAFTHAHNDRIGLFEQAHKGTLFLDEVADMPLNMQVKLLRVLQEGEIRPLGSNKKVKVDVRLVTASNQDLEELVREGKFRQDLLFRINGMAIHLPPLRERQEDIPLLTNYLVKKISRDYQLKASELSDKAYQALLNFPWPGNIRQLESVIRNALLFARSRTITPDFLALPRAEPVSVGMNEVNKMPTSRKGRQGQAEDERALIIKTLRKSGMNKEAAARDMGISIRSFYMRMERHGIPKSKPLLARFLGLRT